MRRATALVILVFALSGASGLVYQLVWIRLFSQLMGGTTLAISVVLAVFMAGLGLGCWRLGRRADRTAAPLLLYAGLEVGVAAAGLAVPLLLRAAKPLYVALAPSLAEPFLVLLRILIAVLILLPPTFLMGGTLPVLARFLVRRHARLGRGLGLLYGVNTLGAAAGVVVAGFALIPELGLLASTGVAVVGNLVAGASALALGKWLPKTVRPAADPATAIPPAAAVAARRAPEMGGGVLAAIFALSGFAAIGCELFWARALLHFLGNSTYAFSAMLSTYLFGLAAGSWAGGRLADRVASPARLLGWVLTAVGAAVAATVPLIWNALPALIETALFNPPFPDWGRSILLRFVLAFAVMILPTFLAGMVFPLVNRIGIAGLAGLGRGVGGLYLANTVGAIAGSLAAGFAVLPLLGARGALLAAAIFGALLGLAVHLSRRPRGGGSALAAAVVLVVLASAAPLLHGAAPRLLSDTEDPGDVVLFQREEAAAEVRVYQKPDGERHMSVDGFHIGGTEPDIARKEKLLAHLPMALAPGARNVLAVGLGSGVTLGTLGLYPGIEHLTCVELVPGVVAGARFFDRRNHRILDDPRTRIVVGDGVQFLLTTRERFDIVSSDSKLNPEFTGNSALLAREYYDLCRDRLTENGVMVQWLAMHFPRSQVEAVLRAFVDAFPHVELFWFDPANILLVGSRAPIVLDLTRHTEHPAADAVRADLRAQELEDAYVLASCRVAGRERLARFLGDGPRNTWLRPTVEFRVAPAYRRKSMAAHQDDNLGWLSGLYDPAGMAVTGQADPDRLSRFRASGRLFLAGYAAGGGTDRLETGAEEFAEARRANPDDRRPVLAEGLIERETRALAGVDAARTTDPDSLLEAGFHNLNLGRPGQALGLFDAALARRPGTAAAELNRIEALRRLGRGREAAAAAADYVESYPRDPRGHEKLGLCLAEAGDFAGALARFRRAARLDPTTVSYRNNVATTLARLERYAEAGETFAAVQGSAPGFGDAAYFAAACFSLAGRTDEAARWVAVCLDEGRIDAESFLTSANFANLRESADWDEERVRAAVAAQDPDMAP